MVELYKPTSHSRMNWIEKTLEELSNLFPAHTAVQGDVVAFVRKKLLESYKNGLSGTSCGPKMCNSGLADGIFPSGAGLFLCATRRVECSVLAAGSARSRCRGPWGR